MSADLLDDWLTHVGYFVDLTPIGVMPSVALRY